MSGLEGKMIGLDEKMSGLEWEMTPLGWEERNNHLQMPGCLWDVWPKSGKGQTVNGKYNSMIRCITRPLANVRPCFSFLDGEMSVLHMRMANYFSILEH